MSVSALWSRLTFGLSAIVFVAAGIWKLSGHTGVLPRVLQGWLDARSHSVVMTVVGVVEIAIAVALIARPTRRFGAIAALGFLAGFSVLIAVSATDERFLNDCGCGIVASGLDWIRGPSSMLFRNIAIACLLVLVVSKSVTARLAVGLVVAVAGLGLVIVSTRIQWLADRELVRDLVRGDRVQRTGWTLPNLPLRDQDGHEVAAHEALVPGDGVMLFSRDCPHCEESAERWGQLAARMNADGSRLVLLEVGTDPGTPEFVTRTADLASLPRFQLLDRRAAFELGVRDVPHFLKLGDGHVVTFRTRGFRDASVYRGLRDLMGADAAMRALAARLFDEFRAQSTTFVDVGGVTHARLGAADGAARSVVVARNAPYSSDQIEMILGLDARGRIVAGRALIWQVGLTGMESPDPFFARLEGLTCSEAVGIAESLARSDPFDGHVWYVFHRALEPVARNASALGLD